MIDKITRIKPRAKRDHSGEEALAKLSKELQTQLAYLRQSAREIARIHASNLEHDLLELADAVKELAGKSGGNKGAKRTLEQLADINDQVSLKPVKGRRKDLARIEKAITRMTRVMAKKKPAK
jgi:hypothetical protein